MTVDPQPAGAAFSAEELAVWRGFLATHAAVTRRLDALLSGGHGLSLVQFDVLIQLSLAGGELRMAELADRVLLSRSGLVRLVDALVRRGLVARRTDPADARGTFAGLTRAGEEQVQTAGAAHREHVRAHFLAPLDASQRRALTASWSAIADQPSGADPASAPRRARAGAVRRRRARAA